MVYVVGLLVVVLDQWIKWLVTAHLAVNTGFPLWQGVLEILYVQNTGAAFSILLNHQIVLSIITMVVIAVIIWADRRYCRGRLPLQISLGMLLGGAVGNLVDRLWHGYVIDYIYVEAIRFPVFNLADSSIVLSVLFLVFQAWHTRDRAVQAPKGGAQDAK